MKRCCDGNVEGFVVEGAENSEAPKRRQFLYLEKGDENQNASGKEKGSDMRTAGEKVLGKCPFRKTNLPVASVFIVFFTF